MGDFIGEAGRNGGGGGSNGDLATVTDFGDGRTPSEGTAIVLRRRKLGGETVSASASAAAAAMSVALFRRTYGLFGAAYTDAVAEAVVVVAVPMVLMRRKLMDSSKWNQGGGGERGQGLVRVVASAQKEIGGPPLV